MLNAELKTQLQNAKDELKAAKMKDVDKQEGADDGTSTTKLNFFHSKVPSMRRASIELFY